MVFDQLEGCSGSDISHILSLLMWLSTHNFGATILLAVAAHLPRRTALQSDGSIKNLRSSASIIALLDRISKSKGNVRLDGPRFHPFPARMPIWLAEDIVTTLTSEGERVLDPMVGSGSTATACVRAKRTVIGTDVDPMALLLSRVASTPFNRTIATTKLLKIVEGAEGRIVRGLSVKEVRQTFDFQGQAFLKYWSPPRSQKQLFALALEIATMPRGKYRDLAWVTLSSLIIAKSAGVSFALDISRSRPHKVLGKPLPNGFDAWHRRSKTVVDRLPFTRDNAPDVAAHIKQADARKLPVEDASIDLVVTSPPYLNAIDYIRAHKFSLVWMGHQLADLRNVRTGMVGTERGMYSPDSLPSSLENSIVEMIDSTTRLGVVRRYLSDLRRVLLEVERVLKPGGAVVMALGPSLVSRLVADAGDVIGELAATVGLENVGWSFRAFENRRRSLPPPASVGSQNALRLRMEGEVFLGLRKQ